MPAREKVYEAIDSERAYQKSVWFDTVDIGIGGSARVDNPLSIGEFILLIEEYTAQARGHFAKEAKPEMNALNTIRKIAGLAVNCMEQHGAPMRHLAQVEYNKNLTQRSAAFAEVKEKSKRK